MNGNLYPIDKPGLVKTISVITLLSGILNLLWGLVATASIVFGTFFFGLLCAPITIFPTILGIFEIIYALKLLAEPVQPAQPSQTIAILEILCILTGNVFSMIVGILALVFYNDPQVKEFFARLNGMPVPEAPLQAIPPAPPVFSTPVSPLEEDSIGEPMTTPQENSAPEPVKKPRGRKVANITSSSPLTNEDQTSE